MYYDLNNLMKKPRRSKTRIGNLTNVVVKTFISVQFTHAGKKESQIGAIKVSSSRVGFSLVS